MRIEHRQERAFRVNGLGRLCLEGQDVATYLFQVPTDETQWARLRSIVEEILRATAGTRLRELPAIAGEMRQTLSGPPSVAAADQLVAAFDRIVKLLQAAQSGLFVAIS
jgi:hypothetical protein